MGERPWELAQQYERGAELLARAGAHARLVKELQDLAAEQRTRAEERELPRPRS